LDTGGGVAKALPLLGPAPFFVVNTDAFWLNGPFDALARMARTWDDGRMDGLLMLHSTVDAYGYRGNGDFCADGAGVLLRRAESEVSPWLFTGIQILHPRLFEGAPAGAFSLNVLWDRAIEGERLYGMVHDGEWFHVGTPAGLEEAETYLHLRFAGKVHR
ncbi:MAG: nucleotidyltransferase family protein, partial [Rhodospirillales bacterium]